VKANPNKIYLTGTSFGGIATWGFLSKAPVSLWYTINDQTAKVIESREPITVLKKMYQECGKSQNEIGQLIHYHEYTDRENPGENKHAINAVMYSEDNLDAFFSNSRR